jgi:hypothetical protein
LIRAAASNTKNSSSATTRPWPHIVCGMACLGGLFSGQSTLTVHYSKGLSTPHKINRLQMASTLLPLEALGDAVAKNTPMLTFSIQQGKRRTLNKDLGLQSLVVHFCTMKHRRPEQTAKQSIR